MTGGAEGSAVSYVIESVRGTAAACWCDSLGGRSRLQPMRCAAAFVIDAAPPIDEPDT